MARRQKNALLDEGLCDVLDHLQKISGATFPRILTAALLQYLFSGFDDEEEGAVPGPEPMWMRLAVELERGEVPADNIPTLILDSAIQNAEWLVNFHDDDKPTDRDKARIAEYRALGKMLKKRKQYWENNVEDFGGKRQAIGHMLEGRFAKPTK